MSRWSAALTVAAMFIGGRLRPAAPVRPGGADQEPRTVPRRLAAGGDRRQPGDHRGRPVADRRRAARRAADRRNRISQRGRGDHRAVQGPRARRVPDHGRDEPRPARWSSRTGQPARCARSSAWSLVKAVVTFGLLRSPAPRNGTAAEAGVLMASPSETTLIVLGVATAGAADPAVDRRLLADRNRDRPDDHAAARAARASASRGGSSARRGDDDAEVADDPEGPGTVVIGFGRVGRLVADMLAVHGQKFIAVEADIDAVNGGAARGLSGDLRRRARARTGRPAQSRPRQAR